MITFLIIYNSSTDIDFGMRRAGSTQGYIESVKGFYGRCSDETRQNVCLDLEVRGESQIIIHVRSSMRTGAGNARHVDFYRVSS